MQHGMFACGWFYSCLRLAFICCKGQHYAVREMGDGLFIGVGRLIGVGVHAFNIFYHGVNFFVNIESHQGSHKKMCV